ncbi:MAG: GDP-mannose 4,6-dehydratase [Armatimonadota bacterium]
MSKVAIVTGVTGQDGAYLSKLLLEKGYKVYGAVRRSASTNFWRLEELGVRSEIEYVSMDLCEYTNIIRTIRKIQPDEFFNLAAQSFVAASFEMPMYTADADGTAVLRILEAIREFSPATRFYQASTSEMFGKVQEIPQKESTPFYPRSPYGVAKLFGHWMTVNYRESYNMHASSGILFNHESPLRGREFVSRKITSTLANMARGHESVLELGNMDAKRDWGFAGDYVEGMWRMLQQPEGGDYVLATNETHTVRKFVEIASRFVGFEIEWAGSAEAEIGVDKKTGRTIVKINPAFYRPAEVELLIGDPAKAEKVLGWQRKMSFEGLVEAMQQADLDRAAKGLVSN